MVFFQVGVGLKDIVIEALHVVLVELDDAVGAHHVGGGGNDAVGALNVWCQAAQVTWSLLEIFEVFGEELDRVLRTVFKEQTNCIF